MNPNVVIIVVDALRADRVGALGGRDITPNIDDFAAESTVFKNAFTTANATDPAVTSIMTGRYPHSSGLINHGNRVTGAEKSAIENVTQLPELLSEAGYKTAKFGRALGRWHRNGFDIYPDVRGGHETYPVHDFVRGDLNRAKIVGNALESIHPRLREVAQRLYRSWVSQIKSDYGESDSLLDETVQDVLDFVDTSSPFFAFVHLMDTHAPYTADPGLVSSYLEEFDYTVDTIGDVPKKIPYGFLDWVRRHRVGGLEERFFFPDGTPSTSVIDAHYDAAVTEADARVGNILSGLREA